MDVVIKFVERYEEESYHIAEEWALTTTTRHLEELRMVVMEYVDGETLHEVKRVTPSAKEEVARALEILHSGGSIGGLLFE